MAYTIEFIRHIVNKIDTLWTLQSKSKKFVAGFLYGALYEITLPKYHGEYYFKVSGPRNQTIFNYRDLEKVFGIPDQFDIVDIEEITLHFTKNISRQGVYTAWLRYHLEGNNKERAVPVHGKDLDILRGVITAANAFGIPVTEIILYKTYKDGVFYDINGLNLPTPQ